MNRVETSVAAILIMLTSLFLAVTPASAAIIGTVNSWQTATTLTGGIVEAGTTTYNNFIYSVGGSTAASGLAATGTPTTTVNFASVNPSNGSVGTWTSTTSLPTAVMGGAAVAYNGYLYLVGGDNGTNTVSSVYYAPLNANGTVGTWQTTTALGYGATTQLSLIVSNGYMYAVGGNQGGNSGVNYVDAASINANGTLGSWSTTTTLPDVLWATSAVISNGYIYVFGGLSGSTPQKNVYYSSLTNGTVGSWKTSSFTIGDYASSGAAGISSTVSNGTLYAFGGYSTIGGTFYKDAQSATLDPVTGAITAWTAMANLPTNTAYSGAVAANSNLYVIGGSANGTSATTNVYTADLTASNAVIANPAGTGDISLTTPTNTNITCANAQSEATQTKADNDFSYPVGLVNICFTSQNSSDVVNIQFVTSLSPSQVVARDFNTLTGTYMNISGATITNSTYNGQHSLLLTYTITASSPLNSSTTPGLITDPVGLAVANTTTPTPTAPDTGFGVYTDGQIKTAIIYGLTGSALLGVGLLTRKYAARHERQI
jgi:N-acetylneuraminic acid mutarotase